MRYKRAEIDSLNLSSKSLQQLFTCSDYIIEDIKTFGVFEPKEWVRTFGKPLKRNIIEAKILHTLTGLTIPLKRFNRSPQNQTIEFAGLHGYNERSKLLKQVLRDKESQLQDTRLTRIDIAIDYKRFPAKVKREILKSREPFEWINSTYLKTNKEKKTNSYINIVIYDKGIKEGLDYSLMRLEFSFRGSYLKGLHLKDMDKAIKKMEKSIKKIADIDVKIEGLFSL
jgi:hypothetical protein